jgi:hypothetical protein
MTDGIWNIVLIALVSLAALGVIAFISLVNAAAPGGMMCSAGMAGGLLVGFLVFAVIAGAGMLFLHRRPQH